MTTPAAAHASIPAAIPARPTATVRSAETTRTRPTDADMIEATFHAFGFLVPGATTFHAEQGHQALTSDILSHLARHGAPSTDLSVIRDWLTARQETPS